VGDNQDGDQFWFYATDDVACRKSATDVRIFFAGLRVPQRIVLRGGKTDTKRRKPDKDKLLLVSTTINTRK
jgi:hypothetical protein